MALRLTEEQHNIVKSREGAYIIIASPGSGKTRCITARVADLIRSGVKSERILCVTFTTKAAREMSGRVMETVGEHNATICTFHSLAYKLFTMYSRDIGYNGFEIVGHGYVKSKAIELYKEEYKTSRESIGNVNKFVTEQSMMKREYRTPETYLDEEWREFYYDLERLMKKHQKITFDDLIYKACQLLEDNGKIRAAFQKRYDYILVDETQDTNASQFRFLDLINGSGNVMIVGDISQSIYRFQGADVSNVLNFDGKYSPKLLPLSLNFRSTRRIVSVVNRILEYSTYDAKYKLEAATNNEEGSKPEFHMYDDLGAQANGVADMIEEYVDHGYDYNDITVLYRNNAHSLDFEKVFLSREIPFVVKGGSFINRREVQFILACLKIGSDGFEDEDLHNLTIITKQFTNQIAEKTLQLLYTHESGMPFYELVRSDVKIEGIGPKRKTALFDLADFVDEIKTLVPKDNRCLAVGALNGLVERLLEVIKNMCDDYTEYLNREDGLKAFNDIWEEFFQSKRDNKSLRDFINEFTLQFSMDGDDGEDEDKEEKSVVLSTIHSYKGLERTIVFVTNIKDGMMPRNPDTDDGLEYMDTINLFYVACSRAKKKLILTAPEYSYSWFYPKQTFSLLRIFVGTELVADIEKHRKTILKETTGFFNNLMYK